jgi:death on curing protein
VNYPSAEQVLFIHARLIQETGGAHGVRDMGLLLSAIARPQTTFDREELYPDLFSKAAALFESLVSNHPFLDGNKRTAITAAGLFLRLNGARLSPTQSELERFTLRAAQGKIGLDESKAWFEENSRIYGAQSI